MPSLILPQLDRFGPDRCEKLDYDQADAYTAWLTKSQYENFTVVSWFLPKRLRSDFRHVYAFCRWADDLGDETGDPVKSVRLLNWWRREVDACYAGEPRHPVFVALYPTIQAHDIPRQPFDRLIDAFIQDQTVTRYRTWDQVLDYCTRSADPVGRLVLYLCDLRDQERQKLSDATCTALQLANFWQDVRRDILERDRVYVPDDIAGQHGLEIQTMVNAVKYDGSSEHSSCGCGACQAATSSAAIQALQKPYRATMRELVQRTWSLFEQGHGLWPLVPADVRLDIELFSFGGQSILKMIENQRYDTLTRRPSLSKSAKLALLMRALLGKLGLCVTGGRIGEGKR